MPLWNYDNAPMSQLEIDTLSVYLDKTKKMSDFPEDYQKKIQSTWRFSAHKYTSKKGLIVPRSPETLDPV